MLPSFLKLRDEDYTMEVIKSITNVRFSKLWQSLCNSLRFTAPLLSSDIIIRSLLTMLSFARCDVWIRDSLYPATVYGFMCQWFLLCVHTENTSHAGKLEKPSL
jgi:hypothetical protein